MTSATTAPERRDHFALIAAEVSDPVQRYLRRRADAHDAADAFVETLTVLWRRLDDVPDDPVPWAYGVARRCLANVRRGNERQLRVVERLSVQPVDARQAFPMGDPQLAMEVGDPALAHAIERLTDSEREIVHLWAWERLEPREIAGVLETTPNAISVALARAKRKLRDELRQDRADGGHLPGADGTRVATEGDER